MQPWRCSKGRCGPAKLTRLTSCSQKLPARPRDRGLLVSETQGAEKPNRDLIFSLVNAGPASHKGRSSKHTHLPMKVLLNLVALLLAPCLVQAQGLADQRAQAQQVAQSNGANNAASIAGQLAAAFGNQQNTEALIAKAKQMAEASPDQAKAIAAAAAVFAPSSAAQIARTIASIPAVQANAAAVAAAVAAVVPASAPAIAAAVAAAVPAQAAAIQTAVSQAVPSQASAIANALAPGAGGSTGSGFPGNTQTTTQNPANFSRGQGQASPTPTATPVSPSQ